MAREQDRNLLFAVLAVQLKGLSPERVMEIAAAWSVDPAKSLPERFRERELLSGDDVELVERLVEEAIAACGDDSEQALESIVGGATLRQSIAGVRARRPTDTVPMEGEHTFVPDVELSGVQETPGRYSHVSEHGRGGMGRVLLVHDAYLGRDVALKELLLPHDSLYPSMPLSPMRESAGMLARFLQEARITGQLEHPTIVPVYEVGRRTNGTLYYTMRLVRGDTLHEAIKKCRNLQERLALLPHVMDVCQALAYAHRRGVIHRDIKPSNIMIGEFGETVLLDWGLAKARGHDDLYREKLQESLRMMTSRTPPASPRDTRPGEAIGTPHYMPPEQARGLIEALDERSDIYAVGAVIYELLTGQPPYDGPSPHAVIAQVIEGRPKPLRELDPTLPPELVSICEKAMQRDPTQRYKSMKDLRDEISRFQSGALVHSYHYSPGQIMRRWYKNNRLMVNAAAAAVLVLLAVGTASYIAIWNARDREHTQRLAAEDAQRKEAIAREEAEDERARARRQQYLANLHLAQAYLDDHQLTLMNQALEAAPQEERDWAWGYLHTLGNAEKFSVHSEKSVIFGAEYDPTGRYIVATRDLEPPGVWNADDGSFVRDLAGEPAEYTTLAFSDDATHIAAAGNKAPSAVWNLETGERLALLDRGQTAFFPNFGPDNTLWLGYIDGVIVEWDLNTGQARREIKAYDSPVNQLKFVPLHDLLLTSTETGTLTAWSASSGERQYELNAAGFWLTPDQRRLLAVSEGGLSVIDTATGEMRYTYPGFDGQVFSLSFNANATTAVIAHADGAVRVLGLSEPWRVERIPCDNSPVNAFLLADETHVVASGGQNIHVVYERETGREHHRFSGENPFMIQAVIAPDRQHLLSASSFRSFQVFDAMQPAGQLAVATVPMPKGKYASSVDLRVAAEAERAAVLWSGFELAVFDTTDLETLATFPAPEGAYARCELSRDGTRVLFCDGPASVALGQVEDARVERLHQAGDPAPIRALAATPQFESVVAIDRSNRLLRWTDGQGPEVLSPDLAVDARALDIGADGLRILVGTDTGEVRVLDGANGQQLHNFRVMDGTISAVALHKDGTRFAALGRSGAVALCSADTGERLAYFKAEESWIDSDNAQQHLNYGLDETYLLVYNHLNKNFVVDMRDYEVPLRFTEGWAAAPINSQDTVLVAERSGVIRAYQAVQ